jgi:deoxyribose-phosphate aldolase
MYQKIDGFNTGSRVSAGATMESEMNASDIAKLIDHTALKPETTTEQIFKLIDEAKGYNFAAVCVNPTWVGLTATKLEGTSVKPCTVIGFPLGANMVRTKVYEAELAQDFGAREIDMVVNLSYVREHSWQHVYYDIESVRYTIRNDNVLKVIIESSALTDEEIIETSKACLDAGAHFVKTSTGFHATGGAKVEHVKLIKSIVGDRALIKASGGIKTYADLQKMVEAGADRIGCSAGVAIMKEAIAIMKEDAGTFQPK